MTTSLFFTTVSLSFLLLLTPSGADDNPTTTELTCANSFHLLEADLLSRPQNRFLLATKFFPPRDANPVIIKVDYVYEDSNITNVWFWSESEFYLIQPLEIFLYTSLFFANQPYRQSTVTLELSTDCLNAKDLHMKVLTQRVSNNLEDEIKAQKLTLLYFFLYSLLSMPSQLPHLPLLVQRVSVMATLPLLPVG